MSVHALIQEQGQTGTEVKTLTMFKLFAHSDQLHQRPIPPTNPWNPPHSPCALVNKVKIALGFLISAKVM